MTSFLNRHRENITIFLPFIVGLLCIFFFSFLYVSHINKEDAAYTATSSQVASLADDLDKNFSTVLDTLKRLSASTVTLDYSRAKAFDPILSLNAYNLFSKSFKSATNHTTYIGIYNPSIDAVVSNLGTSPLDFLLNQHGFSQKKAIIEFINDASSTQNTHTSTIFRSDCGNYLLYLARNNSFLEAPISFALFNIGYLSQAFLPTNASFDFDVVFDDTSSFNAQNTDFNKASSVFPLTYTATFNLEEFESSNYISTKIFFMVLILLSLVVTLYASRKPLKALKGFRHKNLLKVQNLLLKEVIYGIKHNNIKDALTDSNIHLLNNQFFMLLITAKSSTQNQSCLSTDELDELLKTTYASASFKIVMISELTYVVFIADLTRDEIYTTLKPLRAPLAAYYLILTKELELNDVRANFYETMQLLKNNVVLNRSNLILVEDINIKLPISYTFTDQDQKLLLYHLSTQNQASFLQLVSSILDENLINKVLTPEFYKQFLHIMCNQLSQLSSDFKDTTLIFESLLKINDSLVVRENLYALFQEYYLHLTESSPKNDMQSKFLDYIHTNYKDDISLADMATHFNLAVNYVGVLFKEKTGYNFKDYLNTHRISIAKELLTASPHMKIKDLSLEVGFVNINTFIRIFKKYEGTSPGQYQKYLLDNLNIEK